MKKALLVAALAAQSVFAETLHKKTDKGFKLFFTETEIPYQEIKDATGMKYEALVKHLRSQGVVVLVLNRGVKGGNPDLDRRTLNTDGEATVASYTQLFEGDLRGSGDMTGAAYFAPYADMPEKNGHFGRPTRLKRDQPVIAVARNGSFSALIHEYIHHLAHKTRSTKPIERDGVLVHPIGVNAARIRLANESLGSILPLLDETDDLEKKLALKKKMAPLLLDLLEAETSMVEQIDLEELDISSFILENRVDFGLEDEATLVSQARQFFDYAQRVGKIVEGNLSSENWRDLNELEKRSALLEGQLKKKQSLDARWKAIKSKLEVASKWWDRFRQGKY